MWDDFHFKTTFTLHYGAVDDTTEIGMVRIAPRGMTEVDPPTSLPRVFTQLPREFYSLGQDRGYYEALTKLPNGLGRSALKALRDVADDSGLWAEVQGERAFTTSLLRSVPKQTVAVQFRRIIKGQAPLTPYRFSYTRPLGPTGGVAHPGGSKARAARDRLGIQGLAPWSAFARIVEQLTAALGHINALAVTATAKR
jgi:hypothetical protein